jgi:DNA-binding NarL/FixJ family response regulator
VEDERGLWRSYDRRLYDCSVRFAASLAAAREHLCRQVFEVVLLDLLLDDGDGLSLVADINALAAPPGVVVVSGHLTAERLLGLYQRRILAIPKRADDVTLREAIALAAGRPSYRDIVRAVCARFALSRAELDVVLLAVDGKGSVEAAVALNCHPRTIESHWQGVFKKTGARSKRDVLATVLRSV